MSSPVRAPRDGVIRVVLADDDRHILESIRLLINRQPELQVVGEAGDGLRVIELADELDPDAAVVDLHMPQLDGVSAVARLRSDHPHLCLIALTGDPSEPLHAAARDAGADAVLPKSDLIERLVDRLAALRRQEPAEHQSSRALSGGLAELREPA
jgi:DNA-binding NarL/FixJ family response regulator